MSIDMSTCACISRAPPCRGPLPDAACWPWPRVSANGGARAVRPPREARPQ